MESSTSTEQSKEQQQTGKQQPSKEDQWFQELNERMNPVRGNPKQPAIAARIAEREAIMLELAAKHRITGNLEYLKALEKQIKKNPQAAALQAGINSEQPQIHGVEDNENIVEPVLTTAIEDEFRALTIEPTAPKVSTDPTQSDRSSSMDSFPCFTPTRSDISVASSFHSLGSPFNTPGRIGYDQIEEIREKNAGKIPEKNLMKKSASSSVLDKQSLIENQSSESCCDSFVVGANDSPRTAEAKKKCQRKKLEMDQALMAYGAARFSNLEVQLRRRSNILKLNLKGKGKVFKKKYKK